MGRTGGTEPNLLVLGTASRDPARQLAYPCVRGISDHQVDEKEKVTETKRKSLAVSFATVRTY